MAVVMNSSKVNDRRSKTFATLKKNSYNDISNVKFFSFSPLNNNNNDNRNGSELILPRADELINFTPIKNNSNSRFKSIDQVEKIFDKDLIDFKEQINSLEPINEVTEERVFNLIDTASKCSLSENDVQDVLMNLTIKSGTNTNRSNASSKSNFSIGTKISPFNSKLKEYWFQSIINFGTVLEKIESIFYENFWFSVLYLNFWFPKLAGFLRYVPSSFSFTENTFQYTNIFFSFFIKLLQITI